MTELQRRVALGGHTDFRSMILANRSIVLKIIRIGFVFDTRSGEEWPSRVPNQIKYFGKVASLQIHKRAVPSGLLPHQLAGASEGY